MVGPIACAIALDSAEAHKVYPPVIDKFEVVGEEGGGRGPPI